jgi:hypothetical protein
VPPEFPYRFSNAEWNCRRRCDVAADCATERASEQAANWACDGGLCLYTGCTDDDACAADFGSGQIVCR